MLKHDLHTGWAFGVKAGIWQKRTDFHGWIDGSMESKRVTVTWKFNSEFSPEKAPKGKDHLPVPSFLRGELLNFGGVKDFYH